MSKYTKKHRPVETPLQLEEGLASLEQTERKKILIQLTDKAKARLIKRKFLKNEYL